jgi:hypothetical protein
MEMLLKMWCVSLKGASHTSTMRMVFFVIFTIVPLYWSFVRQPDRSLM